MKVAVATEDFLTIAGHAGHATCFVVYEAETGKEPVETGRIDLNESQTVHNYAGGAHPLDGIEVLIAGGAGECFIEKMQRRGITTAVVRDLSPAAAVAAYMSGALKPMTQYQACTCGGDHHH